MSDVDICKQYFNTTNSLSEIIGIIIAGSIFFIILSALSFIFVLNKLGTSTKRKIIVYLSYLIMCAIIIIGISYGFKYVKENYELDKGNCLILNIDTIIDKFSEHTFLIDLKLILENKSYNKTAIFITKNRPPNIFLNITNYDIDCYFSWENNLPINIKFDQNYKYAIALSVLIVFILSILITILISSIYLYTEKKSTSTNDYIKIGLTDDIDE